MEYYFLGFSLTYVSYAALFLNESPSNSMGGSYPPSLLRQGPTGKPGAVGPSGNKGPIVSLSLIVFSYNISIGNRTTSSTISV